MNQILILTLFSWVPTVLSEKDPSECTKCLRFDNLRAHYSQELTKGSFFELPETTRHPLIKNYERVEVDWHFPVHVYCYPHDPRVCLMYDYNGFIAGVQVSFLFKDTILVKNYNYSAAGYIYSDILNQKAWAVRAYFTNPEKLTPAGRKNVCNVVEGIWFYLDNKLTKAKKQKPGRCNSQGFVKQACAPKAGTNYVYKFNATVPCEELFPVDLLYDQGCLVGFGIVAFGKGSTAKKDWYDGITLEQLKDFFPNRPPCFLEWAKKYGFTTFSMFLIDSPWEITCPE